MTEHDFVQARDVLKSHATHFRNSLRFAVPCGNRDWIEHLRKHGPPASPGAGFVPSRQQCCAGDFYVPIEPSNPGQLKKKAPHWRIGKRVDNHAAWANPAPLKGRLAPLANTTTAVSHARARARGFRWVQMSRETPKAPNLVPSVRAVQATVHPRGCTVCNRPEPSVLSVQNRALCSFLLYVILSWLCC